MKSFRHFQEDAAESRGALSARTSGESGNSFQSSQQAALGKKIKGVMDPLGKLAGRGAMATASGIKKAAKAGAKFGRERLTAQGRVDRAERRLKKMQKKSDAEAKLRGGIEQDVKTARNRRLAGKNPFSDVAKSNRDEKQRAKIDQEIERASEKRKLKLDRENSKERMRNYKKNADQMKKDIASGKYDDQM